MVTVSTSRLLTFAQIAIIVAIGCLITGAFVLHVGAGIIALAYVLREVSRTSQQIAFQRIQQDLQQAATEAPRNSIAPPRVPDPTDPRRI